MADETQKDKQPEKAGPAEYTPEQLIDESRAILGVASHVAVGALHGVEEEKLTVAAAKSLVKSFMKREGAPTS